MAKSVSPLSQTLFPLRHALRGLGDLILLILTASKLGFGFGESLVFDSSLGVLLVCWFVGLLVFWFFGFLGFWINFDAVKINNI